MRRIAFLLGGIDDAPGKETTVAFREALAALGWIDGRNLVIDERFAAGQAALLQQHAQELVQRTPDVIVVRSSTALREMRRVSGAIPLVFVSVSDPVRAGYVKSLARPGGNMTGFMNLDYDMTGKWLQLLKEIAPKVTRVLILQGANNPNWPGWLRSFEAALPAFGLTIAPAGIKDRAEIEQAIGAFARTPNGGMIVLPDPFLAPSRAAILELAARHRLPAVYGGSIFNTGEGLVYYGFDQREMGRLAAGYVDRILKGEKAGELPIQAPTKFELIISTRVAKALGLTVPATLLVRADRVFE
ncbi:MAG TPA: ABC transporter substrate-binding protein [Casimicrobiaceae bacterium]|nr:ABC transporter substrate-binding protein [Casimicrobiaceae bacterium]